MSDPVSWQVLDAIRDRLEGIYPDAGYNTDVGDRVNIGKRQVNPDQLDIGPVVNVYDTSDEPDESTVWGAEPVHATMTVMVDAFIRDFDMEGTKLAHLVAQDIFNAVLDSTDLTLGGLALDLGYAGRTTEYPEGGGDTIMVSMEFTTLLLMPYGAM